MDLIYSTATTDLHKQGGQVVEQWQTQYPRDYLLECLDDPVVVFGYGGEPIGLLEVSYDYFEDIKWLQALWVHPDHRLKGYGSAIVEHLIATCNYSQIKLFSANHSAPFYEKHGFRNTFGSYYVKDIEH